MSLSEGVLGALARGEEHLDFVAQVLATKPVGAGQERYRLLISDGVYQNSFSMLATQFNHLIHEKKLENFTIIKVKKHMFNKAGSGKKVLILMDIEVIKPGSEVGAKIGNPENLPGDGSAPPPRGGNQNQDPNVGLNKRPASGFGGPEPKVPATNRSVLSAKPNLDSGSSHLVAPIASISPYQNKWTIKARVTSKSDIRTWNKASGSGKLFSMDLMDESGEIRATAFKEQCDQYYDMIQVGKVYYISRCTVKAANKQYSKLKNDYELTFKDNVMVEPVIEGEASDVPTMSYDFAAISDLSGVAKDTNVDIIGICKESQEPIQITTRAGKELMKREVTICDQSNSEVKLTLWGATAESFSAEGAPVIAVKGTRVGDYNGVTLSGGDLLINPDLDQTSKLRSWWDTQGRSTDFSSLTVAGQKSGGMGGDGSLKSISEVKMENLGHHSDRGDYYSCMASITYFQKDKALYKACPNQVDGRDCNKKVQENGDGTFRCEKCSMNLNNFKWRLMLSINMGDYSDGVWATCFQETAEKLLGRSSEEVGNLSEQDEGDYNKVFTDASFKTYSFRMRAKADEYNDEKRVKHTIIAVDNVDYAAMNKMMIKELESAGQTLPNGINRDKYM
eukprot:TRINITY_DN5054_c0_g2_i1.p1 TRINITY_DN5054_c0_g2~~TRINITY_DN5054_c0_g2_i1.p1  ORF type:complete len:620 (+),score=202.71 TRINITY_DN5054_c0_g2_i1:71-1930(+)